MRGQFGEFLGLFALFFVVMFVVLIVSLVFVVNILKLPLLVLIAIVSFSLMYKLSESLLDNRKVSIIVSFIFTAILSFVLYYNWLWLIIGLAILIPVYGIIKEFTGGEGIIPVLSRSMYYGMYSYSSRRGVAK